MTNRTSLPWRYLRLAVGLVFFGVGLALVLLGDFGLPPWDILHQGIAETDMDDVRYSDDRHRDSPPDSTTGT